MRSEPITIAVRPARVALVLTAVIAVLVVISYSLRCMEFMGHMHVTKKFDLDSEQNVPTYFSALLIMASGSLCWLLAALKRNMGEKLTTGWWALGGILAAMSVEEVASMHESLSETLRGKLHVDGILHFAWIVPAFVFLAFLVVGMWKTVAGLPKTIRRLVVLAAVVYFGGAVGWEMVDGLFASRFGENSLGYQTIVTIEETCEMLGMTLMIYTLLDYIRQFAGGFDVSIEASPAMKRVLSPNAQRVGA